MGPKPKKYLREDDKFATLSTLILILSLVEENSGEKKYFVLLPDLSMVLFIFIYSTLYSSKM